MNNRIIISEMVNGVYTFCLFNNVTGLYFTKIDSVDDISHRIRVKTETDECDFYTNQTNEYIRDLKKMLINTPENVIMEIKI